MNNELHPVWQQVERLLDQGVNLVPVRDRDEEYRGKLYAKKTPYSEWKKYVLEKIDRQELFQQMEQHNTTAVAMVCGAISGNLEVIDVDVKYLPGIDARLFSDLQSLYPDLLAKLRVHKSPSGGCHIVYRIAPGNEVPGSAKLASRAATEDELLANDKLKSRCFIETRGTGGLCTAPPSLGYIIRKDCPIPVLTWEERCTLIELCRSYNTFFKPPEVYKPNKAEANYYDESPFEHYNKTIDPVELFQQCGWTYVNKRGDYLLFTRPGGKKGDVHASFNLNNRYYFIFTVNSDLESDRAYNPATVLAYYHFNNDKQRAYQWLVEQGFGRIKQHIEQSLVKRAALTGNALPANVSQQGRDLHAQAVEQLSTSHPHGIFWAPDEQGVMHISRLRFQQVADDLGFKSHNNEVVQVEGVFLHRRDEHDFFLAMKAYINEEDGDMYEEIFNAFHAFYQKNAAFCINKLDRIEQNKILKDTREVCYKFYTNGCVVINSVGYTLTPYDQWIDWFIWHEKVQPRDFVVNTAPGLYTDFLERAVNLSQHSGHIMRCIGYLAHDWKDETTGYIIVLTEQCPDPRQGGGTGKNLLCNLFNFTTTYTSIPGSQAQFNEKFLQSWNGQRIFGISDVEEKFPYGFLKDMSTGSALIKKLFKNDQTFKVEDLPKFVLQTNFSFDITDGGLKRRIIYIEFTNFFTEQKGVKKYYGKHFTNDWTADDFAVYDTFICQSVGAWLAANCELGNIGLSETGWEKQFIQNFNEDTLEFIEEHKELLIRKEFVFNSELKKLYDDFMINRRQDRFIVRTRKLNNALEFYFEKYGYKVQRDVQKRNEFNGKSEKGILIYAIEPPF